MAYANRGYVYAHKHATAHALADYTMRIKRAPDLLAYIGCNTIPHQIIIEAALARSGVVPTSFTRTYARMRPAGR